MKQNNSIKSSQNDKILILTEHNEHKHMQFGKMGDLEKLEEN